MISGLVKGDSHKLEATLNTNITDWKIRVELYDDDGNSVKLASANSGGSTSEIQIVDIVTGVFYIIVANGLTTGFNDNSLIEIEVTTNNNEVLTILQDEIAFKNEKITWSTPT